MLKVKNLTFEVNEEGKKRCLVNHITPPPIYARMVTDLKNQGGTL